MKSKKLLFVAVTFVVFFVAMFLAGSSSSVAAEGGGIITCGRGQSMCTLCDLIAGMNTIIKYLMKIAVGVALLAMTIGGVMYIVSYGDKGMIDKAKGAIKNAAIGFAVIFAGYLIINTTISYIGSRKDEATGKSTFGMNITSWGEFDCSAQDRGGE
ncbi:MAG: hypothetical protein ACD_67C00055G0004 [uncultured bacterium]|nr:MAG: hypothetical protein ACD_67C00055G0004 [uncultured bacterium]